MNTSLKFAILAATVVILFGCCLIFGSVDIPAMDVWRCVIGQESTDGIEYFVVVESRLPMAVTALLAGASLAVSGLMLQSSFRNPLAGPSVLGISSGASLGVAIVMLLLGGSMSIGSISAAGNGAVIIGAFLGSMLVTLLMVVLGHLLRNSLMLLITGMMVGYLTSSVIMLLNFWSSSEGIRSYVMWGMSTFSGVSNAQLPVFAGICLIGIAIDLMLAKPLDLLLLGDDYAANLGVNMRLVNALLLFSTGLLTAIVTAFCGPVAFLGLALPHIARIVFPTDSHRILIPATLLSGAAVALGCCLICVLPSQGVIPLNAVTPLIGAPVVVWVLCRHKQR